MLDDGILFRSFRNSTDAPLSTLVGKSVATVSASAENTSLPLLHKRPENSSSVLWTSIGREEYGANTSESDSTTLETKNLTSSLQELITLLSEKNDSLSQLGERNESASAQDEQIVHGPLHW